MTSLLKLPEHQQKNALIIGQLYGSSMALALSERIRNSANFNLIITEDSLSAQSLHNELVYFLPDETITFFPDWETLPYDLFSPHQDLISERLAILSQLSQGQKQTLIVAISSLLHPLPDKSFIQNHSLLLKKGQTLDLKAFKRNLNDAAYRTVNKVIEHGECAYRGAIIDLFPMGSKAPYRIELFDDEIDSIRQFCPETQRSTLPIDEIALLPAREFPLDKLAITKFRQQWRESFSGNPSHCSIYNEISEGIIPAGIEYYLPLFFNQASSLFDYIAQDSHVFVIDDALQRGEKFYADAKQRYEQRAHDITRPILKPQQFFFTIDTINQYKQQYKHSHFQATKSNYHNLKVQPGPALPIDRQASEPLFAVQNYIDNHQQKRILIIAESAGRREVLIDLFHSINQNLSIVEDWASFIDSDKTLAITQGPLQGGFELIDQNISVITETQLFGSSAISQRKRKSTDPNVIIKDLTELKLHAPVVHIEHGVGRYKGLQLIDAGGEKNEFLVLHYADDAKIYVPVTSLNLISRYTGGDLEHAPLHRLGNERWQKEKKKAEENISDVACELLDIYARREAEVGFSFSPPDEQYKSFTSQFPFEETPDQASAIENVIKAMCDKKPMDHLVCGDVGFGKTEVAMRAAFLAIQNNKQVCILVPTTLLADQHFENFQDRFADFPVNIALLSRFRTKKETDKTLVELQSGQVDIVIGTHKLFQKDIEFKSLGLLIIDEEHRFGVKQKEHIRSLRTHLDVLCLTATPIPRTLNMAMSGLRDISIIATPPAKRLAIKTFAQQKNKAAIKEAILREILRGGQIYYLHNNVDTISRTAEELREWLPEAKIDIAHGQMRERQLEKIMADFYHHRFNVLVCTTIIETGIDIPTANTIIIDRADKFGLAQLHQLRGRVGRSHHQAYAYLLTPDPKAMSRDAQKRLDALLSLEDLGAGFMLATHDLEIRGAGELLGDEQSGNMHAIGFTLYMDLLQRAVKALRSGKQPALNKPLNTGPDLQLHLSTVIPEDYMGDVHTRLVSYKRIANCEKISELNEIQSELIDRFGLLPQPVKDLFRISELKLHAKKLGITQLKASEESGKLTFSEDTPVTPDKIIQLIQMHAKRFKLAGSQSLKFCIDPQANRIDEVFTALSYFND